MATHELVSRQGVMVSVDGTEGAGRAEQAPQYARPEVVDLGSLDLVQAGTAGWYKDYKDGYYIA